MTAPAELDTTELVRQIKVLYRQVALDPSVDFHFPVGRPVAEQLGYPADLLDRVPAEALASFAGVGYALDLAALTDGERVLDLGSGSGTDSIAAALLVGPAGQVTGVDMTDEQRAKAERLAAGLAQVRFVAGRLEDLPLADATFDVVISNGVINLCPDKAVVFAEASRVLKPGGRLAVSDIVSARPMPQAITCSADLWSACIGGAAPETEYLAAIEAAGLRVHNVRENPQYTFLTPRAQSASKKYGVRSITLLAVKP
ncbi:methyltransferase domain-containing protein [Longispora sp. K20-0274]|uniref:methyltransferase domain-containing protein n=1 Tax=Longispora sp. K20-0274 TaxID=3088255 RepID=UPI003999EECC